MLQHNNSAKSGRNSQMTRRYKIKVTLKALNTHEIRGNGVMRSRSLQLKTFRMVHRLCSKEIIMLAIMHCISAQHAPRYSMSKL